MGIQALGMGQPGGAGVMAPQQQAAGVLEVGHADALAEGEGGGSTGEGGSRLY